MHALEAVLQVLAVFLSVRFVTRGRLGPHWLLVSAALLVLAAIGIADIPAMRGIAEQPAPLQAREALEAGITVLLAAGFYLTEHWFALKDRIEGHFRLVADVDRSLVGLQDEAKILSAVCEGMTRGQAYSLAWIGHGEPDGSVKVVRSAGEAQEFLSRINERWDESSDGRGPAGTSLRTGEACIVAGIGGDPRTAEVRAAAAEFGLRSCASVPIAVGADSRVVLSLYSQSRRAFDAVELASISALAGRLGAAICMARRHALFVSAKTAYDDLLRTQRDGVMCVRGGKIVRVNQAAAALLGYDEPRDLVGCDPAQLLADPDSNPKICSLLQCGDPATDRFACEAVVRRKDGTKCFAEISANWVPRPDGPAADGIAGWKPEMKGPLGMIVIRDITRKKQVLEDVRRERDFTDKILRIVGAVVVQLGPGGEILLVNPHCEEVTGYRFADVKGRPMAEILLPPSSRPAFLDAFAAAWEGRIPASVEYSLLTKTGQTRQVVWNHAALVGPSGRVTSVIAAGIDLTDRRRLEEQVVGMQRMEAVGTLAGGIAHDFNNILTGILGNLDLAWRSLPEGSPVSESVQDAMRASERAAALTRQLLEFSRRSPMERHAVDFRKVLREVVHLVSETIDRRIEVSWTAPDALWPAAADGNQIHQVLMNLCVNARDAIAERLDAGDAGGARAGGCEIRLAASNVVVDEEYRGLYPYARTGEFVLLTVSDNGVGMDDATQRRIFEPFFTTKKLGRGTGLGLSTVYGIVKQHDGWINLQSVPGQGTVFSVYFPRAGAAEVSEATSGERPAAAPGRERILFVDDEAMIRELARRILEGAGYTVLTASDGRQALDIFARERERLDLVILDVTMPLLSGLEVLRRMRELQPGVRVILCSGYPTGHRYNDPLEARAAAFLQKPYRPDALSRIVRDVLDGTGV